MPKLKPWYKVINPREDLREGRPLDASEFAVHLDHIRDGHAHIDYQDPVRFFERTFLTRNLRAVSGEVLRRLNGINTESGRPSSRICSCERLSIKRTRPRLRYSGQVATAATPAMGTMVPRTRMSKL